MPRTTVSSKKKPTRKYVRKSKAIALQTVFTPDVQLDLTLKSITELYPTDPTMPGMSLAWLPDKQLYYASIVRFRENYGGSRQVIYKAYGPSIFTCILQMLEAWRNHIKPKTNATDTLRNLG
jgi:hypothetical protein